MEHWERTRQNQTASSQAAAKQMLRSLELKLAQIEAIFADPNWSPDPEAKAKILGELRGSLDLLRRGIGSL